MTGQVWTNSDNRDPPSPVENMDAFHPPVSFTGRINGNGTTRELPVYVSGKGNKPLLVLHELPGMTPQFLGFCNLLIKHGFQVTAPLFFGAPGQRMSNAWMLGSGFCVNRQFNSLFQCLATRRKPAGLSYWLIDLLDHMAMQNGGRKTGVVGMCLTGGFALAGIAHPSVEAGILAQPSLPFFGGDTTRILDADTLSRARNRASALGLCLKGYRYERDGISKDSHFRAVENQFGTSFEGQCLAGKGHATLTNDFSWQVAEDVLAFLKARL